MAQEGLDKGMITLRELAVAPAAVVAGQGSVFVLNTTPSSLAFVGDDNATHGVLTSGVAVLMSGQCNASGSYIGQYQASGNYLDSSQVFLSGVAGMSGDWVGKYVVSGASMKPDPIYGGIYQSGALDVQSTSGLWVPAVGMNGRTWASGNINAGVQPVLQVTSAMVTVPISGMFMVQFDGSINLPNGTNPMAVNIGLGIQQIGGAIVFNGDGEDIKTVNTKLLAAPEPFSTHSMVTLRSGESIVPLIQMPDTFQVTLTTPHLSLHLVR